MVRGTFSRKTSVAIYKKKLENIDNWPVRHDMKMLVKTGPISEEDVS